MGLNAEGSAALVFLILYSILFLLLLSGYVSGLLQFRSRYTVIFFHVTIRLASQATGVASGIVGLSNINLLIAYFILGAEGYFTLVLCTYRFLINWQYHNTASHDSWIEPRHAPNTRWYIRVRDSFALPGKNRRRNLMGFIHLLLISANSIIISGGSQLASVSGEDPNSPDVKSRLRNAKILRLIGQSVFLAINVFLLFCIISTMQQYKREQHQADKETEEAQAAVKEGDKPRPKQWAGVHRSLWLLLAAWPLLIIRGVYGVLAGVLTAFSFFNPNNYTADGLKPSFVASEYVLSALMEWASCALLMLTFWTSFHDPPLEPLPGEPKAEGDKGEVGQKREVA